MKILLLSLAACLAASAQVTITGPLLEATGKPVTCRVSIHPVNVPGIGPSEINYRIADGDLSGVKGGYLSPRTGALSRSALKLSAGTYMASFACVGSQPRPYLWTVPQTSSITIQELLGFIVAGKIWTQMLLTWAATTGTWAAN